MAALQGHLRILASPGCGRRIVAPLLAGFHAQHRQLVVELLLREQPADFTKDRIDVSFGEQRLIRQGVLVQQLMAVPTIVCASSAYARTHGLPQHVDELDRHRCISFRTTAGYIQAWEFRVDGLAQRRRPTAQHTFNDLDMLVQAVSAGLGIAQLPAYLVSGLRAEGKLVTCLSQFAPEDGALYLSYQKQQDLPARIRAFAEYMTPLIKEKYHEDCCHRWDGINR